VQQKVEVTVMEVDVKRKRIALSMKGNKPQSKPAKKESRQQEDNDLQTKLNQLKNLFK
jgi:uncharacterized protein